MTRSFIRRPLALGALFLLLAAAGAASAQVVIVDNADTGFSVLAEAWSTASGTGQYGTDYRYRSTTLTPAGLVEWRPNLPAAGQYAVDVWYRTAVDRPSNACFTVAHVGGSTDVLVDQRVNGSTWFNIGSWEFAAGTAQAVTLTSAAESGKSIVADAVRFRRLDTTASAAEVRACWLTHYTYVGKTDTQLRQIAQNMLAGNINTVYVGMYSGQTVWWPSQAYKTAGGSWGSSTIDYAARLTTIFHEEGLKVGAWLEYGLAVGYETHAVAVAHPDWLARTYAGDAVTGENGGFVFISPGHPDGTQMLVDMVTELAANYDFDDIQLDRIRWSREDTGREYGYEQVTRNLYFQTYAAYPPTNVNDAQWVAFREGLVDDVMERCYAAIKAANPHIVVSAAPTGYYGIQQFMQRWSDWVYGGYIDFVMPQMYMTTLATFQTEFNKQAALIPDHLDLLGVGYRAQDDDDWQLVASELDYARNLSVPHACLWVYHQYTSQIAIQDEIDNLPAAGEPWELPAYNPFVSPFSCQLFVDNSDGTPAYNEYGGWAASAQADYFRFNSRVTAGGADAYATFGLAIPLSGRYDVWTWYTASSNRNPAAEYDIQHYNGTTPMWIDQRSAGGQWVPLGRYIFESGPLATRVTLATAGSSVAEYTSSDAIRLRLVGYALCDANGDGVVDALDYTLWLNCGLTGPNAGPTSGDCEAFDCDDDLDLDLRDLAELQRRFGGA